MPVLKILQVVPAFYPTKYYGGPTESTYRLCCSAAHNGCDIRVLTTDANGPQSVLDVQTDRDVSAADGIRIRYCHRWWLASAAPSLLRSLPSYVKWADVVHLTSVYSFPTIPTLLFCRIFDKPVVWSPRGSLQRWPGSTRRTVKFMWEWLCRTIAGKRLILHVTSDQEAEASRRRIPGVEIVIISNGIDVPGDVLHVSGKGVLRLLYLGRIHPIKGIDNLLAACARLNNSSNLTWSLTIAGGGKPDFVKALNLQIDELKLNRQVVLYGEADREDKEMLFQNSDIVILPSHNESFGMVIAEALAHGVPVIAGRGTPWQRLEEVGCGLWVNNDPESLAKAIEQMGRMPIREMGVRGREWMMREFTWKQRAREMLECYASFIT